MLRPFEQNRLPQGRFQAQPPQHKLHATVPRVWPPAVGNVPKLHTGLERRNGLLRQINLLNENSSSISQMVREFWRQYTVVVPDRTIDYMTRASSNIVSAWNSEMVYRLNRLFVGAPLFESHLELDKLDKQPYLKAFGIKEPQPQLDLLKFPTLRDRLLDDLYGSDYKAIPRTMRYLDDHWSEEFDPVKKHQVMVKKRLPYDHQLLRHLDYWLDFRNTLTSIQEGSYAKAGLPYFPENTPKAVVNETVDHIKDGLDHMRRTGMTRYLFRAKNLFRDMANGRYSMNGNLHIDGALYVLDKALGDLWMGKGNLPEQTLIKCLINSIEYSKDQPSLKPGEKLKKSVQEYFGMYKAPHQKAQQILLKRYRQQLRLGHITPKLIEELLHDLMQGKVEHNGQSYLFYFKKDGLGLTKSNINAVSQKLSHHVNDMQTFLRQAATDIKGVHSASEMQALGQKLADGFDERYLNLVKTFPGVVKPTAKTGKTGAEVLEHLLKDGINGPAAKLFRDGVRAEFTLIHTLKHISKTSFWPQIVSSVAAVMIGFGPLRAWIDQQVAQPYQEGVVKRKGNALGASIPFLLGDIAGVAAFTKTLNNPTVRNLFRNSYFTRFLFSSLVGFATLTGVTIATLVPLMRIKPDVKKDAGTLPQSGPSNAVNPLAPPMPEEQLAFKQVSAVTSPSSVNGRQMASPTVPVFSNAFQLAGRPITSAQQASSAQSSSMAANPWGFTFMPEPEAARPTVPVA